MAEFTQELQDEMVASQPLDWESAQALAEKHDVKARAVVASAVRRGLEYKRKERVSKTGEKVASKSDLVANVAARFDLAADDLAGLEKATKDSLRKLLSVM